ncbi:MAG: hypothetical protein ACFFGZ_11360 [Candidatus Thorarchaeota archaeon]
MSRPAHNQQHRVVLDCNLWIKLHTKRDWDLAGRILQGDYQIILTSYMVVEILRALKRLARKLSIAYPELESLFWDFCSHPSILMAFEQPFGESLIAETIRLPEYRIIGRLLDLEVKDVPYLVAAFQHKAILVSENIRSLVAKRQGIQTALNIDIKTSEELLRL